MTTTQKFQVANKLIDKTPSHFKITAKLGEGGMGEVCRGENTDLERRVVLEILPPEVAREAVPLEGGVPDWRARGLEVEDAGAA